MIAMKFLTSARKVVTVFLIGLIIGLGVSPFVGTKPQNALISPVTDIFAENYFVEPRSSIPSRKMRTMATMFKKFDIEQSVKDERLGSDEYGIITVAAIGDSMIDTMGTGLPYLDSMLSNYYPNGAFKLYNYGIGAETIKMVRERVGSEYSYKDRDYNPILNSDADVLVVGSAAYNPFDDINEYSQKLSELIFELKRTGKPVIFVASIAPLKELFGVGPNGVNWPSNITVEHVAKIKNHMETGISIAQGHGVIVVDAYHLTLHDDGEGFAEFVSVNDGIHPSVEGHQFVASELARAIANLGLL